MCSGFHRSPSAAPPLAPSERDTRKDRPHAPAPSRRRGQQVGGGGRVARRPRGAVWRGSPEPPHPAAPFQGRLPPGPRLAPARLRSIAARHPPRFPSRAPGPAPGQRTPGPSPAPAAPRPPAFPARPAPTFTCTFCTRGGSSGEKHLPGTATSPAPAPPGFLLPLQGRKVDGVRECVRERKRKRERARAPREGGRRAGGAPGPRHPPQPTA